jgi:hypothetical protein
MDILPQFAGCFLSNEQKNIKNILPYGKSANGSDLYIQALEYINVPATDTLCNEGFHTSEMHWKHSYLLEYIHFVKPIAHMRERLMVSK